ncbi:multiple epidermal growth factor-like domains protein 11 [Anopheles moucheti]|uniref:multiple epidermal growth factor-like domains protein 11 n=1 Tax=Anopheles moucheti TaxID=186751 RepID=UPI0022F0706E|nr:multiple epidermal growth factor-like domains protein 11 [Anopheles moucheti]
MRKALEVSAGTLLLLVLMVHRASSAGNTVHTVNQTDHSLDSVCVGFNAGIIPHPDPSRCDVYITCTFQQPTAHHCAEEFIFDPISLTCIEGDRDQCPERNEPDLHELCVDVSYAVYQHPSMCWEFVLCLLGTVNRFSCPVGEIWSQQDGACRPGIWDTCEVLNFETYCHDRPDGVLAHPLDCASYVQCDSANTTIVHCPRGLVYGELAGECVAGNTETCRGIDSFCEDAIDGTVLAHPNECDMFVSCQEGSASAHHCPAGEILNEQAQFCAPGNPDTCQLDPVETMCQNATNGAMFPLPDDCTQFVKCNGGKSSAMKCPMGQILHAASGSCRPGNTDTCELVGSVCQDQPDGFMIAHPSQCSMFITCQGGAVRIQSCPKKEIHRADAQFCVPGNSLTCEFEPIDRMCVGKTESVNYPHPTDCSMYVVCHLQKALAQNCPSGSIYDAPSRSCIPGNESTCEPFDGICSGRSDGIIPHPTVCTAFVYCSSGQPVFEQCAPGTIYKQGSSGCVVGNTETCAHATNVCSDHPDGATMEHPNDCSLMVTCMMQQPAVFFCPEGAIFNKKAKFCSPGNAKTCQLHPVELMCGYMSHGSVHPHPNDCAQYVRCNGGQPVTTTCPAGHVLHASSGTCRPGNSKTCEILENVCHNQSNGTVLEHPSHCGHFIACQGGAMSIKPCPVGEILHPDTQLCVPGDANSCEFHPIDRMCLNKADSTRFPHPAECAQFVACQGKKAVVQSCPRGSVYHAQTRSCVPGNEATCEQFDNICSGRQNELIPHPLRCSAYINCTSNQAAFEQCAMGTVFDRELKGCLLGNTKTCVRVGGLCEQQPNGTMLAHPNECDLYIRCFDHKSSALRCPTGDIFNAKTQFCAPGNADTCQLHPVQKICKNMRDKTVYSHPDDCTRFIKCNVGKAIVNDCPAGEILDGLSKLCKPGNTETCKLLDKVCRGRPDGLVIEHPSNCGHYIKCRNGAAAVHSCSKGEILRSDTQVCVPGNASTCEFEPIERACTGKSNGRLYPHPTDCQSYIRCESSAGVEENCPPGTIFLATTQSCVAGNGNTCAFLDDTCVGRADGVLAHPQGCGMFLMCTAGTTSALSCPEGEMLHPELLVCAAGNADDCTLAPVTTEPAPIISSVTPAEKRRS